MTANSLTKARNPFIYAAFGAALLALPVALPNTAKADDFKIHLNLGGGAPYYYNPPVERVVYRDYRPERVVYVSRPVYRERIVYRDYRGHKHWRGKKHNHDHDYGRWHDRDRYVAWR